MIDSMHAKSQLSKKDDSHLKSINIFDNFLFLGLKIFSVHARMESKVYLSHISFSSKNEQVYSII